MAATRPRRNPPKKDRTGEGPAPLGASPRQASSDATLTSGVEVITPELAEQWLLANQHNRHIRQRMVDLLAEAIKRGEWQLNGDAIRFAEDGTLLDGQHRLWAIVFADQPVESVVIRGLPNEVQDTMDMGMRRGLKDVLALRGYSDASQLAAALNLLYRVQQGSVRSGRGSVPTVAQALQLIEDNPGLMTAVKKSNLVRRGGVSIPNSVLSVAYHQFSSLEDDKVSEDVEEFYARLADGVELKAKSPILALRRQVDSAQHQHAKPSSVWYHAILIKAWNHYRLGNEVELLSWKQGGAHPEPWPEPL